MRYVIYHKTLFGSRREVFTFDKKNRLWKSNMNRHSFFIKWVKELAKNEGKEVIRIAPR
jgi:hypothetical protein